jgi:hypothetical protein
VGGRMEVDRGREADEGREGSGRIGRWRSGGR